MAHLLNKHVFPDGRVAHTMTHTVDKPSSPLQVVDIVRWEDMEGNVTGWGKVERIVYSPTLGEQYLNSREVIAQ